jgi:hypothetical protein
MIDRSGRIMAEAAGRQGSPALSDFSELTILSRSPSPVLDYDPSRASLNNCPVDTTLIGKKLRGNNGRYVSKKRAHSPEERYVGPCEGTRIMLTIS